MLLKSENRLELLLKYYFQAEYDYYSEWNTVEADGDLLEIKSINFETVVDKFSTHNIHSFIADVEEKYQLHNITLE